MSLLDVLHITRKIARPRLEQFLKKYATSARTLDIGSGDRPYRHLFPNSCAVDAQERPGVPLDYVADAHDLSVIPSQSFDVVLCTEVLEHLHTPHRAIAEFRRVLKPQGLLLLSTRFIYPLHETPIDYFRFTKYGLQHLLRDFHILELQEEAGTIETLAILYQRLGFQCDTLWLKPWKLCWFLLAKGTLLLKGILTSEYGDIHHQRRESAVLASGYYVAARVVSSPVTSSHS